MYSRATQSAVVLTLLVVALPLWARTDNQSFSTDHLVTIGSKQLNPGEYEFKADEGKSELTVLQAGKVVADIPGRWVQLQKKPEYSEVIADGDHITRVQFEGRAEAFQLR